MAIKASTLAQLKRTTTCKILVPNDEGGGGFHEEEIRIVYYSPSIQWYRDHSNKDDEEKKDLGIYLSEMIAELPDVIGDDGKPQPPTIEFFRSLLTENCRRINVAIGEDLDPGKKSPSPSLPATSRPAAKKAARSRT